MRNLVAWPPTNGLPSGPRRKRDKKSKSGLAKRLRMQELVDRQEQWKHPKQERRRGA